MTKLTKLELRKSRLKILAEIDRLDKLRCSFCHVDAVATKIEKSSCTCESAVKVKKLGIQLNKLVSPRKTLESKVIAVPDVSNIKLEDFTVELYEKMKLAKLRDYDIRKLLGTGGTRFVKWKDENGLSKKSKGVGKC